MDANINQSQDAESKVMRHTLKQQEFLKSEAASMARVELKLMLGDPKYNTRNAFSAKTSDDISFVDKHMQYLCDHPKVNPRHYLSNLKLKTRIRT